MGGFIRRLFNRPDPRAAKPVIRWGLLWYSNSRLSGKSVHIIFDKCLPVLFKTRREARTYAKARYGYIAESADLLVEPHGWTVPRPVRLTISPTASPPSGGSSTALSIEAGQCGKVAG